MALSELHEVFKIHMYHGFIHWQNEMHHFLIYTFLKKS